MTTTATDSAAVILDRAAAGKPLTTDEVRVLRHGIAHLVARAEKAEAERDRARANAKTVVRLFMRAADRQDRYRQAWQSARDRATRADRRRRDAEAHLTIAHQNVRALREQP